MIAVAKIALLFAALSLGTFAAPTFTPRALATPASAASVDAAMQMPGGAELRHFGKPDDVRTFPKGRLELVKIGGATIGRAIFQPGWKWSESVMPLAKTKSCEAPHFQYHVYGILKIRMDDGTEIECHPGDVSYLPAGHDAWVVGDEPAIVVDFHGMVDYAKGK